ncbi:hypothetical protein ABEB36_014731 [Hypothenemus hampei]|uniref:Lipase domain-containing protein n=1 Tax=Hypothenemus hampei TaxID=57062 RepID=A0ABD1E2P2_HYPHA
MSKLKFTFVILIFLIIHSKFPADTLRLTIPTQKEYLIELLNTTINDLPDLVDGFTFEADISAEDISIIHYQVNGENNKIPISNKNGTSQIELTTDQIVVIIHGWKDSGMAEWIQHMIKTYQTVGRTNTLAVDWAPLAAQNYLDAAAAAEEVGNLIGNWLLKLLKDNIQHSGNIHMLGHSLGAHIAGFAGKTFKSVSKEIHRITGLDASAPLFEYPFKQPESNRLCNTDAFSVEAYHTCIKFVGFNSPLGQQDYYVNNGGPIQPGCTKGTDFIEMLNCSHFYSHEFYTKTIRSSSYIAIECNEQLFSQYRKTVIAGENSNGTSTDSQYCVNADADFNREPI